MYNVGVIGLGSISMGYGSPGEPAPYCHVGGILQSNQVRLAAVADLSPERREKFRAKWGASFPDVHYYEDAARMLADDEAFPDPAALLVTPDHYVTRLLHANGVPLDRLLPPANPREIWREFASRWHVFAGTPVRYWLEDEGADVFGVDETPATATADAIYDGLAERLASPRS